jgi:galactokinase
MTGDARTRALAAGRRAWGDEWTPYLLTRAPGRLELLGNHVDYNGGKVLAAAIDRDVVCLVGAGDPNSIGIVFSDSEQEQSLTFFPDALTDWRIHAGRPGSADYARGVIASGLERDGKVREGVRIGIAGDVPIGFGLSSSAALCVALTLSLHEPAPAGTDLVLRAQEAEHRAGTPCGTMDQSASVGGNVILFDGASVTWRGISPNLGQFMFAVADSGVSRSLGVSSYARRVSESQQGLEAARSILNRDLANLADVTDSDLSRLEASGELGNVLLKRVRHIVSECGRVDQGLDAVENGNWSAFGRLMNLSGVSSADDYEISHPAVEEIVSIAKSVDGVLGARMMGGGEGGTALILLSRGSISPLRLALDDSFYRSRDMRAQTAVQSFAFAPGASIAPISAVN